jgi:MFS family permease
MKPLTNATEDFESSLSYPGWKVVAAGFFGVMVSFAALVPSTFSLFIKPLSAAYGWHREAISGGFSIAALTVAVAAPVLGFLLDRIRPRRIILPCFLVFSLAYISLSRLTPHLIHFYLAFFFIGLVGAGTSFLGYSRVISTWFDRRRGVALSVMLAGAASGSMFLPLIAQAAITHYGWRVAFAVLGLVPLAVGVPLTALFVRERPIAHQNAQVSVDVGESVGSALRGRVFWIIVITVCLSSISVNGVLAHLSALLTDRGVSTQGAAYAIAIIGTAGLLGRFLIGAILDRFFGVRVYQTMLLITGIAILVLSVAHMQSTAMVATALVGFSTGGEADITPFIVSRYFGLRRLSTLYSFTWTAHAIGAATGPLVVGWVFDSLGSYRSGAIQLLALPALIPCVLMFLMPRYADRRDSHQASTLEVLTEIPAADIQP